MKSSLKNWFKLRIDGTNDGGGSGGGDSDMGKSSTRYGQKIINKFRKDVLILLYFYFTKN